MVDLTLRLSPRVFGWWGDRSFEVSTEKYGDGIRMSSVCMSLHTGTHIDLPSHYGYEDPEFPDVWIGKSAVVPVGVVPPCGDVEAIFIRTGQGELIERGEIERNFVALDVEYVDTILGVCRNLRFLGIDAPSVDPYGEEAVHRLLLSKGIFIVESLKMPSQITGIYKAVIAPLRIEGVEAYPAKVFLLGEVRI